MSVVASSLPPSLLIFPSFLLPPPLSLPFLPKIPNLKSGNTFAKRSPLQLLLSTTGEPLVDFPAKKKWTLQHQWSLKRLRPLTNVRLIGYLQCFFSRYHTEQNAHLHNRISFLNYSFFHNRDVINLAEILINVLRFSYLLIDQ